MPVTGVNHITLTCSDLNRSIAFYIKALDAELRARWSSGAYLEIGTLWLCLERGATSPRDDDSHIAFDCPEAEFANRAEQIREICKVWKENRSEGASLYFLDPDGHKLELHAGSLTSRLKSYRDRDDVTFY